MCIYIYVCVHIYIYYNYVDIKFTNGLSYYESLTVVKIKGCRIRAA